MIGKNIFAERLKKERTDRGLSQNALGKMVGLSKSTICKYETSIHPPKIEHAQSIAEALKVSFSYLIGFSEHRYIIEGQHIADLYLLLSDSGKKELYNFAEFLYRKEQGNEGLS